MEEKFLEIKEQGEVGTAKAPSFRPDLSLLSLGLITEWARWSIRALRRFVLLRPITPTGKQLKATSWLDGLRGFAALMVYFHHHQLWVHNTGNLSRFFEHAYGWEDEYYFGALPGVRTFFSGGHYAVSTFFVISGYVLSTRPLALIHDGDYEKLATNLSSALFRRWIRLFIPTLATTFLWLTTWHAFGWYCQPFDPEPTYIQEVIKWISDVRHYLYLYRGPKDGTGQPWLYWNLHTWSIPFEFRGSLAIYTVTLAFAMCSRNARLLCTIVLIFYFQYMVDGWYLAMFLSGMLLCDLDMLAAKNDLGIFEFLKKFEPYKKFIFTGLFLSSVYLGGVPDNAGSFEDLQRSPGWVYLSYLKPDVVQGHKWFYLFWAATFLVAAVPRLPWLKSFFDSRFCQYLGRVSFSLYLMHGPVIWTLGNLVYNLEGWPKDEDYPFPYYYNKLPLSRAGPMGLEPSFWIAQLILLPATLWVSNIITVLVDEPSVKFAAWVRNKTLVQPPGLATVEMAGGRR